MAMLSTSMSMPFATSGTPGMASLITVGPTTSQPVTSARHGERVLCDRQCRLSSGPVTLLVSGVFSNMDVASNNVLGENQWKKAATVK